MLKATLVFWDRSFNPREAGHSLSKLCRMIRNKVRGASQFEIPAYFNHEKRFLSVSRYPSDGKGVLLPSHTIPDLDRLFVDLITLVPFQHNTELRRALGGKDRSSLIILRRRNGEMRKLRGYLAQRRPTEKSNV